MAANSFWPSCTFKSVCLHAGSYRHILACLLVSKLRQHEYREWDKAFNTLNCLQSARWKEQKHWFLWVWRVLLTLKLALPSAWRHIVIWTAVKQQSSLLQEFTGTMISHHKPDQNTHLRGTELMISKQRALFAADYVEKIKAENPINWLSDVAGCHSGSPHMMRPGNQSSRQ